MERPALEWWQTRWFALAAILVAAVPLLWPGLPPLLDLPGHMARYRVMLGTDAATLDQWYEFHWRAIGYLGVDVLVYLLTPLLGLEPAVKLIVIAIPMLTVAGILWISREAHGRVQPAALFALPLAYSMIFLYGFLNYTLAMALALNAFALWLRLGRQQRFRLRAALFVPIAWIIWGAHLFGWLVLGCFAFLADLMRERAAGRGWLAAIWWAGLNCLPLAFPFAMLLRWTPGDGAGTSDWLESFSLKPGWVGMVLRDRWEWFDVASVATIGLLLYHAARSPKWRFAPQLGMVTLGLCAAFVVMPFGTAYADARLAPYGVAMALLAVVPRAEASQHDLRRMAMIGLVFCLIRMTGTVTSMTIEARAWDRHLAAVEHIPHGSRVAGFVTNNCKPPWALFRKNHLPSVAVVRRGAFANDQFDLGSTGLMHVIAPGVKGYAMDPSEMITNRPCATGAGLRDLRGALAGLPRDRFDYVWLIEPQIDDPRVLAGLSEVWSDGTDRLYRVNR